MSERKELGRIQSAYFGMGGYQEAMLGFGVALGGKGWGVGDFVGGWAIDRSDHAKWSEADRQADIAKAAWRLKEVLEQAHKKHVGELAGVPVEVTFDGLTLKSWRVLTEVLA